MASRSLKSQVLHAVSTSFYGDQERGISGGFGTSKHSDKISNQKAGKIYSYDCYNNRQDVAKEFCSWMKNEHPEIRRASDLTERHATEFLAKLFFHIVVLNLIFFKMDIIETLQKR